MFDSLDETMKRNDKVEISRRERLVRHMLVTLSSILVFGGLYLSCLLPKGPAG
jgi:hypothetical protein